jgi:hypothetical protein
MVVANNKINDDKKCRQSWQFGLPCGFGGTMRGALPDEVHPWLHAKPLDAAIGQVPAPYFPGGCHG